MRLEIAPSGALRLRPETDFETSWIRATFPHSQPMGVVVASGPDGTFIEVYPAAKSEESA